MSKINRKIKKRIYNDRVFCSTSDSRVENVQDSYYVKLYFGSLNLVKYTFTNNNDDCYTQVVYHASF